MANWDKYAQTPKTRRWLSNVRAFQQDVEQPHSSLTSDFLDTQLRYINTRRWPIQTDSKQLVNRRTSRGSISSSRRDPRRRRLYHLGPCHVLCHDREHHSC